MNMLKFPTPRGESAAHTMADSQIIHGKDSVFWMVLDEREDTCSQNVLRTYTRTGEFAFDPIKRIYKVDKLSSEERRRKRYALAYIGLSDQEMPE